eukprot:765698-Hanusia_phi.AAC.6
MSRRRWGDPSLGPVSSTDPSDQLILVLSLLLTIDWPQLNSVDSVNRGIGQGARAGGSSGPAPASSSTTPTSSTASLPADHTWEAPYGNFKDISLGLESEVTEKKLADVELSCFAPLRALQLNADGAETAEIQGRVQRRARFGAYWWLSSVLVLISAPGGKKIMEGETKNIRPDARETYPVGISDSLYITLKVLAVAPASNHSSSNGSMADGQ